MAIANFTTGSDVKRVSRLTNEIPDDEINEFIESVNQELIRDHGYPVKRIRTTVLKGRPNYYLDKNKMPFYSVDRVFVDGSVLGSSLWTSQNDKGFVTLGSEIYDNDLFVSKDMKVDFIPSIYHELATYICGRDLIESQYLVSQEGGSFPRVSWFNKKIDTILNSLSESPMYSPSKYQSWSIDSGELIDQNLFSDDITN